MYENSGSKIKGLATTISAIGIGFSILIGLMSMLGNFLAGLIVIAVGCLMSWLSGLLLAGFGELVENSYKILHILSDSKAPVESLSAGAPAQADAKPAYFSAQVTSSDIHYIMETENVPYGEAMMIAKKRKAAAMQEEV